MSSPLYVFDMDDTLINGDCAMLFNAFLVEKGVVTQSDFLKEDQRLMQLYTQGKLDMASYLQFAMAPLTDLSVEQVHALVEECLHTKILPKQFAESKTLLAQLDRDGIDRVIISASVTFLVEAVGHHLGIPDALGIDLVTAHNRYTATIAGVPSYQEGKVARLEAWLNAQSTDYSAIHFFTDSINDLPLCLYADYVYLVNPCSQLRAQADQPNWTILSWE
ncbi:HAD family hydrolase [Salinivibrio costicola]|uniref:HAD family hydrolase n=1 Tax=Salinivibrio costicola TaxID=51367 RepID=A0ABX6K4H7_SALCS|nr:HAD family hydrolase [Salinivibrio costicola]QIR06077.1 HAD family hydrolase [Salinivibrio costicola]